MATQAQIEANRRNAEKSTGPRTEQGKENSSRNATKFGLFSRHVLLSGEDEAALTALRDGLRARLKPADALEEIYLERIITASWRLQRALAREADLYARWQNYQQDAHADGSPNPLGCPLEDLEKVQKHIASLERSIDKAVAELGKLQKQRRESEESEGDRNDENKPNPVAPDPEVTASSSIQIVKTNPIPRSEDGSEVGETEEIENEQNEPKLPTGAEPSMLQPPGDSDRP